MGNYRAKQKSRARAQRKKQTHTYEAKRNERRGVYVYENEENPTNDTRNHPVEQARHMAVN